MRKLSVLAWVLLIVLSLSAAACSASEAELVHLLKTATDEEKRADAAAHMAELHSVGATQDLVAAAKSDATAAAGLAALRDEYIAHIAPPEDGDWPKGARAIVPGSIECLGIIADGPTVQALAGITVAEGYPIDWQMGAVKILASVQTEAATAALIEIITAPKDQIYYEVVGFAKSKLNTRLAAAPQLVAARMATSDSRLQGVLDDILREIGAQAVPSLVAALAGGPWPIDLLYSMRSEAVSGLGKGLSSDQPLVRQRSLGILLRFYGDNQALRDAAAPYLATPEMVPALVDALDGALIDFDFNYGHAIGLALADIGNSAIEPVFARLGKSDWAPGLLAKMGASVAPKLAEAVMSGDPALRDAAFAALIEMYGHDPQAAAPYLVKPDLIPQLIGVLSGDYAELVRKDVSAILTAIGKPAAVELVAKGASLLGDEAEWTDQGLARTVYDLLKGLDAQLVIDALADKVLNDDANRLHALFLGIKLGIPGSQERLNQVLAGHGNKEMAEDFLNAGSEELYNGGKEWAESHGYFIETGPGSSRASWGSF